MSNFKRGGLMAIGSALVATGGLALAHWIGGTGFGWWTPIAAMLGVATGWAFADWRTEP